MSDTRTGGMIAIDSARPIDENFQANRIEWQRPLDSLYEAVAGRLRDVYRVSQNHPY